MKIEVLSRPLTAEEIDFRVGNIAASKDKTRAWVNILAYKDARVDMKLLDEAVGQMNWQTKYERDSKGILQCGIGIYSAETLQWIWKWSNGVESNSEAEKGEYSDALKRAGFLWGIGRHLYEAGGIFFELNPDEFYISGDFAKASNSFKLRDFKWRVENGIILQAEYKGVIRWVRGVK